jgi:hypothetical protein
MPYRFGVRLFPARSRVLHRPLFHPNRQGSYKTHQDTARCRLIFSPGVSRRLLATSGLWLPAPRFECGFEFLSGALLPRPD